MLLFRCRGHEPAGACRSDVHRDVADQLLELIRLGDEVGLAVDLDQDADLATGVDVGADYALGRDAARLLGRRRQPLLAQQIDRLVHVAAGLRQGGLAIHHAGAGALAQLLDHLSGNLSQRSAPHLT